MRIEGLRKWKEAFNQVVETKKCQKLLSVEHCGMAVIKYFVKI